MKIHIFSDDTSFLSQGVKSEVEDSTFSPESLSVDGPLLDCSTPDETTLAQRFNSEDTKLLISLAITYKKDWKRIAAKYNSFTNQGMTPELLRESYKALQAPVSRSKRGRFTEQEDARLKQCVEDSGFDWDEVSKTFPNRCLMTLRDRYNTTLKEKKTGPIVLSSSTSTKLPRSGNKKVVSRSSKLKCAESALSTHISELDFANELPCLKLINMMLDQIRVCPNDILHKSNM